MYMLRTEIRKLGGLICFLFVMLAIQAQQYTEYRIHFLSRSLASSSSLTATVMWIISSHRAR